MSLFEDEFYSTRMSRREAWRLPRSGWLGRVPGWMLAAGGGAALIVLTLGLYVGAAHSDADSVAEGAAVPALAVPSHGLKGGTLSEKQMSDTVVGAAGKVWPTVVSIVGTTEAGADEPTMHARSMGLGSGVIFSKEGNKVRIVTNNHVVEGFTKLDAITVTGEKRPAVLLGRDQITDLAVLEIDGSGIKEIAEFGDSDALQPGETAIAVGNPLGLGFAPTVTKGIISWPKRTIPVTLGREGEFDWEMDLIQTDAAINQGNSGGALVNLDGKVVGINTLKVADMGVEGIGFAIPINQARGIIDALIKDHKVKRPYIGVVTQDLQSFQGTEELKLPKDVNEGVLILEVLGPAKAAGLASSDVIVELDGTPIDSTLSLRKYVYGSKRIGDKLKVTYYRGGKKQNVTVTLEELQEK
ncbi:S1C family serine protease [Paenibacillus sp. YYML68]|uniref:S1C family serine protease n=1 Tax=Paenibacillus sp. YYML68 TaxID=2909250 RepID=UPI0024918AF2|nr:trypsin-like peptidase domain-containing protein [Paenibacillus sp. YYML68]